MYKLKKIFKNEKGQGMVEYGLILATVSIVAVLGLSTLGGNIKGQFEGITDSMDISEHRKYSDEEIQDLLTDGFIPIATAEDLNSVRNDTPRIYGAGTKWVGEYTGGLNKKYIQVLDIDLSGYSEEEGWAPIGSYTSWTNKSPFTGTYDGGNYVIKDLEVNGAGKNYQGLFGYIDGATISNVALKDVNVTGSNAVGGLVGEAYDNTTISNSYATGDVTGNGNIGGLVGSANRSNTISNSYATGSVKGSGDRVGGLVGQANFSNISNSYATGSVTGASYVGGLVGSSQRSTGESIISNSYATGSVKGSGSQVGGLVGAAITYTGTTTIIGSYATGSVEGSSKVGGLVGEANFNNIKNSYATGSVESTDSQVGGLMGSASRSTISNSYATGAATGYEFVGGLAGYAAQITKISNSYAIGEVTGSKYVGGLVGFAQSSTTISNSYWDKVTTGKPTSAGQEALFGKLTVDMMDKDTYSGWDFVDVWEINDGVSYPTLITNPEGH